MNFSQVSGQVGFPVSTDEADAALGEFSEASDMSADEVAEVLEFECEIDVVDGDLRRDFEHDR